MMMKRYKVEESSKFKREYRKMAKRGYDMTIVSDVVSMLVTGKPLPPKHDDHALQGKWKGYSECHITPDWLLIYKIEANVLILT